MDKKVIGSKGEDFAAEYFRKLGYKIKAKNYHSRHGEVDVVAENDEFLVFIEVKTRKDGSMVPPAQAVTSSKQRKLIMTAMKYIDETQSEKQPRFDVFEVWQRDGRIFKFNNIESAFDLEEFSPGYEIF